MAFWASCFLNLCFLKKKTCISFESEEKLSKNCIFSLLDQSNAFTEPIQHGNTLENWHLKKSKNATLNGCISKARANSESKLTFSDSSFNFLQNSVIFCTFYLRGYTAGVSAPYNPRCRCQRFVGLKELNLD